MTAKEIFSKHTKSNGCRISLQENPFLEQAILNALNEAINYTPCCETFTCDVCFKPTENKKDDENYRYCNSCEKL